MGIVKFKMILSFYSVRTLNSDNIYIYIYIIQINCNQSIDFNKYTTIHLKFKEDNRLTNYQISL